jgi:cytochrome c oxidase assembly factor CtaG
VKSTPYGFDLHPAAVIVILLGVVAVVAGHRRLARTATVSIPWTRRERWFFGGACAIALVATAWPLGNLAAHWSLTALVVQRLMLALAVAPLLLLGLPYDVIQWLTRPRLVDALLTRVERPPAAIATVTVVLVGSMVPAAVTAAASSLWLRALLDLVTVAAGLVLWIPVVGRVHGIRRPKPVVRFGYLVGQAIVPAFLSVVYIFSAHALYPTFSHSKEAVGMRPVVDQQIAGFVSKLSMIFVLLGVGAVVLAHASSSEEESEVDEPLVWADVERELERAARREARHGSELHEPLGPAPGSDPEPSP